MHRQITEAADVYRDNDSVAEATAVSIEQLAAALSSPEGVAAMELQLKEKYLDALSHLGKERNQIIMPKDLSNYDEIIQNLSIQGSRSEEHTSELQSRGHLVCRLL